MIKFKSLAALSLVFLLLCSLNFRVFATNSAVCVYAPVEEVVYAVAPVNIRTGAGTEHSIVDVLRTGQPIRRIGVGSQQWSMVVYHGETAYIHSSYLTGACPEKLKNEALIQEFFRFHGLKAQAYTTGSWENVTGAVDRGCEALRGEDLSNLEQAALDLGNAMDALIPMNYQGLEDALAQIPALGQEQSEGELWLALLDARQKGAELLESGDQAAVDALSQQILELLTQIKELPQPEAEVILQQVPTEVLPQDDFCNIPIHGVWRLLLIIGGAVATVLVAVVGLYFFGKKLRRRDHTPLVDYDISDDA